MDIKTTNFLVDPKTINDNILHLDETESHHLAKVFRAQKGDIFYAIDGNGKKYRTVIKSITLKKVVGEIINSTRLENEPLLKTTLAVGLCRPAKIDYIIEKGTEIGINKFIFFTSEKTLAEDCPDNRAVRKLSRWQKIAVSAAKQSLRTVVPEIMPPVRLDDILVFGDDYDTSLIADMKSEPSPLAALIDSAMRDILLLVGPESGLSDIEVDRALKAGFKAVKLGPRRLRVETAAVVFASLVLSTAGEL
ncbi:MAG: 16S rRNA (uracil(1498)-N(3))-methyltransferase [candidate division Zixibacteria bacterium]|nr:16S rRNA (uracil(1498)-N(3))-methyltransferase [candidate division Zixibacteria bacterium]